MRALRRRRSVVLIGCAAAAFAVAALGLAAETGPPGVRIRAVRAERLFGGRASERPLALAFVDDSRFLAVTPGEVRLFRMGEADAGLLSHIPLPGPRHSVRGPAALIAVDESGLVAWILSNQDERARLVDFDRDRLGLRAEAEALPWAGSTSGLRYRDGTDWIEGDLEGIGAGPFLAIARDDGVVAVSTSGALLREKADATLDEGVLAVGPMLAPLWPGVIATSKARPPSERDEVVILERTPATFAEVGDVPVDGAVRALAGRVVKADAWLVASIETARGYEVLRLRLERVGP